VERGGKNEEEEVVAVVVVVGVVGVVGMVVVEEEKHCIRQAAHLEERERRRGVRYW
jgi:hypothetical protein